MTTPNAAPESDERRIRSDLKVLLEAVVAAVAVVAAIAAVASLLTVICVNCF